MFTIEQIKAAHDKVKSGADFPDYIKEIKRLGVTAFETWVIDSHTEYFGDAAYRIKSDSMYTNLVIEEISNEQNFNHFLKMHQQGKTDYLAFCRDCAATGIEKWFVSLDEMICIYYDKKGKKILAESIPG